MDSHNPSVRRGLPVVNSSYRRTQISVDYRRNNVKRLIQGWKTRLSIADREGLNRIVQFVSGAEEEAFKAAISNEDYSRRIAQLAPAIHVDSPSLAGNSCNKSQTNMGSVQFLGQGTSQRPVSGVFQPGASGGFAAMDSSDWKTHLEPEFRRDNLRKVMDGLTGSFPGVCDEALLNVFERIALKIEGRFYDSAKNRSDYLNRVSEVKPEIVAKARNFARNPVNNRQTSHLVLPQNNGAGVGSIISALFLDEKHQPLPRINTGNAGAEMGGGTLFDIINGSPRQIDKHHSDTSVQKGHLSLNENSQQRNLQHPTGNPLTQQLAASQQSDTPQDMANVAYGKLDIKKDHQPLERLVQALKSASPETLSSLVMEISSAISAPDRIEDKYAVSFGNRLKRPLLELPIDERFKRPRATESNSNHALLKEIDEINGELIDTVVEISNAGVDHGGTIVQCCFKAVSLGQNLKSLYSLAPFQPIRLLIPMNYPNCSPVLLEDFPVEASNGFCHENPSVKARSRFSFALRILSQPMSVGEMARAWDICAREVISEFAQQNGGGSFSNKYGAWKSCLAAGLRTYMVGI